MMAQAARIDGDTTLLRRATRLDGILTALFGADLLLFARPLAGLTGVSAPLLLAAGVLFVGVGLLAFVLGARPALLAGAGRALLFHNLAWLLALPLVLAAGWLPLTAVGTGAIVGLILVTAAFAVAQWLGLRRLGQAALRGR